MRPAIRPGHPSKDSPRTHRFQVRLPIPLYERIEAHAERHGVSIAEAARRLIHRGLNPHVVLHEDAPPA